MTDVDNNIRPWGFFEQLGESVDHNLKRVHINPGKRLSLQKHTNRSEHWFIVRGEALVTIGERETPLKIGESIDIPAGVNHRISNTGSTPLVFIEVQMGSYFGDDDIIRIEDDFGRE